VRSEEGGDGLLCFFSWWCRWAEEGPKEDKDVKVGHNLGPNIVGWLDDPFFL
jgi:hypothetical protein